MSTQLPKQQSVKSTIVVENLIKKFPVGEGVEVAVDGIDLNIDSDEFITLVGPSGCGKTTTLRCIAGLEMPTKGKIYFEDNDITQRPANKRNFSFMFQNIALYPHMKVNENIAYPLKVKGVSKKDRDMKSKEAARMMKIDDLLEKYPGDLSGGQQQRAALARTIVQEPNAFLLDEPLSDLDAKLKVEIRREIQNVHKEMQKPTIYVTHDQEEAMTMSDRIAVMNDGKIEQIGPPGDIYQYPQNKFVASFIGNPTINFFDGFLETINEGELSIKINNKQMSVPIDSIENQPSTDNISIGIRPEELSITNGIKIFDSRIKLLERVGQNTHATMEGPSDEFRIVLSSINDEKEGNKLPIYIKKKSLHIFDEQTGRIIAYSLDGSVESS